MINKLFNLVWLVIFYILGDIFSSVIMSIDCLVILVTFTLFAPGGITKSLVVGWR